MSPSATWHKGSSSTLDKVNLGSGLPFWERGQKSKFIISERSPSPDPFKGESFPLTPTNSIRRDEAMVVPF